MILLNKQWILLICMFLCLVSCSPKSSSDQSASIRLVEVTHSLFYAPQYVAMSKGFFEEEGLTIELTNGNGSDKTMTTLLAEQADIILAGTEAAIYVNNRSTKKNIIPFAKLTQADGSFLVSRKPLPRFTWSAIKGKTLLGQRRGGMPEMVSEHVLRKNGITPHKDVKILQNVDFKNIGNAFLSGTGDFVQLFEPTASLIEQQNKGFVVASFAQHSGQLPYTCYMSTKQYIKNHNNVIRRFIRAVTKGQEWVETHSPTEIALIMKKHFPEANENTLIRVIKRYKHQGSFAKSPSILNTELKNMLNIMKEANELPRDTNNEKYIKGVFYELPSSDSNI